MNITKPTLASTTLSDAQEDTPELHAYFADERQMRLNVLLITLCNLAWGQVAMIILPLMALRLLSHGVTEGAQAGIATGNSIAVAFLVMYFAWKSDHTVSRFGRRKPYLLISAPFIIVATWLFPFLHNAASLVILFIIQMIFMDMKSSTFPLLSIDCVRRDLLARAMSFLNIANGIVGFFAMQVVSMFTEEMEWLPYVIAAVVMLATTITSLWIKEPPIQRRAPEKFTPLSAIRIGLRDRRMLWLMLGVALIFSFQVIFNQWTWIWSSTNLNLDRKEILQALSWCSLINIALAYPIGWLIDRWGGFRVVVIYFLVQMGAYFVTFHVHDKASLTVFAMMMMVAQPLYQAADMMVYKRCDPKDVGSITATNSFIRNIYIGILSAAVGLVIELGNRNYTLVFTLAFVMTTIGLGFFVIFRQVMKTELGKLTSTDPANAAITSA